MKSKNLNILQITDLHIFANDDEALLKRNTDKSCQAVVKLAHSLFPTPDAIILTGDLSQDYTERSYQRVAEIFTNFDCPIYWIPGNHDDFDVMEKTLNKTQLLPDKHLSIENWDIILLNSLNPGKISGYLTLKELGFFKNNAR